LEGRQRDMKHAKRTSAMQGPFPLLASLVDKDGDYLLISERRCDEQEGARICLLIMGDSMAPPIDVIKPMGVIPHRLRICTKQSSGNIVVHLVTERS
jgi:hypothetical protein